MSFYYNCSVNLEQHFVEEDALKTFFVDINMLFLMDSLLDIIKCFELLPGLAPYKMIYKNAHDGSSKYHNHLFQFL